jgi:hypothetical protein
VYLCACVPTLISKSPVWSIEIGPLKQPKRQSGAWPTELSLPGPCSGMSLRPQLPTEDLLAIDALHREAIKYAYYATFPAPLLVPYLGWETEWACMYVLMIGVPCEQKICNRKPTTQQRPSTLSFPDLFPRDQGCRSSFSCTSMRSIDVRPPKSERPGLPSLKDLPPDVSLNTPGSDELSLNGTHP